MNAPVPGQTGGFMAVGMRSHTNPAALRHQSNQIDPRTVQDEELPDRICVALLKTGRFYGNEIDVDVDGDRVVLYGSVPTYYLKQLAQTACLHVAGVKKLQNEIEVI
jgi:osmotically-inducible protein OsmY